MDKLKPRTSSVDNKSHLTIQEIIDKINEVVDYVNNTEKREREDTESYFEQPTV